MVFSSFFVLRTTNNGFCVKYNALAEVSFLLSVNHKRRRQKKGNCYTRDEKKVWKNCKSAKGRLIFEEYTFDFWIEKSLKLSLSGNETTLKNYPKFNTNFETLRILKRVTWKFKSHNNSCFSLLYLEFSWHKEGERFSNQCHINMKLNEFLF